MYLKVSLYFQTGFANLLFNANLYWEIVRGSYEMNEEEMKEQAGKVTETRRVSVSVMEKQGFLLPLYDLLFQRTGS